MTAPLFSQVDHIGFAVRRLDDGVRFWSQFGLEVGDVEEIPEQRVKTAAVQLGETRLELLEPTAADSPVAKFLETRGEGVHHVGYRVARCEDAIAACKKLGLRMVDEAPRLGAGQARIAFVHPKSAQGVLLELTERAGGAHRSR